MLAALGALAVLAYVGAAASVLPGWIVSLTGGPDVDDKTRLKAVTDTRGALLGLLTPLAVVIGGIAALLNYQATAEQSNRTVEHNRDLLEVQRRGQVTERFSKAIEQLGQNGNDRLDVRIGAVYALEQIASESTDLHWPIMEVLTAYLRHHARAKEEWAADVPMLPADYQAIMTVIGRRKVTSEPYTINLREVDLRKVDLREVDLRKVDLRGVDLRPETLTTQTHVSSACAGANLRGVNFSHTDLRGAILTRACLVEADLTDTNLERAQLEGADLTRTKIRVTSGTRKQVAPHLGGAKLAGVIYRDADRLIVKAVEENQSGEGG